MPSRICPALCAVALIGSGGAAALASNITIAEPSFDRWNYPFNPSGATEFASVFSDGGFQPFFDLRDAQFLNTYITAGDITPGLGAGSYTVSSAILRATIADANGYILGGTGGTSPLELFASNFRGGFDALSYGENGPFGPSQFTPGTRNAFAADALGNDVSNNPGAIPLAIGTVAGKSVGDALANGDIVEFALNLADPQVHTLLAGGLNAGVVSFSITTLEAADETGGGAYPRFATQENQVYSGVSLDLVAEIPAPGALGVLGVAGVMGIRRRR